MSTGERSVVVKTKRLKETGTAAALSAAIRGCTGWSEATEVFSYAESVAACTLERVRVGDFAPPDGAFEGRLFDGAHDVRWVAASDGEGFDAWHTSERGGGDGDAAVAGRVRCYLLGKWHGVAEDDNRVGLFLEGRYARKEFRYPLPLEDGRPVAGKPDDRAFIEVIEYAPAMPAWQDVRGEAALRESLNAPRIFAHRFAGVGLGRDPK